MGVTRGASRRVPVGRARRLHAQRSSGCVHGPNDSGFGRGATGPRYSLETLYEQQAHGKDQQKGECGSAQCCRYARRSLGSRESEGCHQQGQNGQDHQQRTDCYIGHVASVLTPPGGKSVPRARRAGASSCSSAESMPDARAAVETNLRRFGRIAVGVFLGAGTRRASESTRPLWTRCPAARPRREVDIRIAVIEGRPACALRQPHRCNALSQLG